MLSIIIPTCNEAENIGKLIFGIDKVLGGVTYEIIMVDDNSCDGCAEIAKKLANEFPLKLIRRDKAPDLSQAVVDGFKKAKGDNLAVMDADFSHHPSRLVKMQWEIKKGYDFVIGSRLVEGGRVEDWPLSRRLISVVGRTLVRPLTGVRDPMSGYFMIKRRVIRKVGLNPLGYKICLEILVKGKYKSIKEVPIVFQNRFKGKSKANARVYIKFLRHFLRLYLYKYGLKKP